MKKIIVGILLFGALVFGGYYYYMYQSLLAEQQQLYLYNQLVVNGHVLERDAVIEDSHGKVLISVQTIQEAIDPSVYLSGSKSRIYIPMLGKNVQLETSKLTQFVRQHIETINFPIVVVEDERYVELAVIEKLYGLLVEQNKTYNTMVIDNRSVPIIHNISGKVKLYGNSGTGMQSIGKFETSELVFLSEKDGYQLVKTSGNEIGYIKTDAYTPDSEIEFYQEGPLNTPRINNQLPENFALTWHQVGTFAKTSDIGPQETLPIDVISPTWFALNVDGIVINEASADYVQKAHEKGYKVWGLYSNSFKPEWTKAMFASEDYSNQSIAQLLIYSALYDLEGINFDFENMYIENRADYVAYIETAVGQLQYQNVRTSIDVTVPWGSDQWSKVYDRVELSKLVDYMCLMAYDEFWAASKKAGPVASMSWVEKGITDSLKLIPKEKLVLAVPLYMRTWAIQSNGNAKSKSMGWKSAQEIKSTFGNQIVYDKTSGQNFVAYKKEGTHYKLWLEDKMSLENRLDMIEAYDLAGTAFWSKIFANDTTWQIIRNVR